jgi:hypothetical protein
MTATKQQPGVHDFDYQKHGTGGAATAAVLIADGKTVSFDLWNRVKDADNFLTVSRDYKGTKYFGLLDLNEGIEGRSIALRVSDSPDLDAAGSSSLIASWTPKEITSNPVFIAAELVAYLSRWDNYFLQP